MTRATIVGGFRRHRSTWGERNAGMLLFVDGSQRPEYVPWADVEQINLIRTR